METDSDAAETGSSSLRTQTTANCAPHELATGACAAQRRARIETARGHQGSEETAEAKATTHRLSPPHRHGGNMAAALRTALPKKVKCGTQRAKSTGRGPQEERVEMGSKEQRVMVATDCPAKASTCRSSSPPRCTTTCREPELH